jgi:hypothetical protein
MKLRAFLATTLLLLAGASLAQTMQAVKPIQMQPLQVVTPKPDLEANDPDRKIARLEAEKRALQEENARLRAQNEALTALGGSQVHAYCPSREISRNTAGAENNCASAGYNCEAVSGVCHTSCSNGDACAAGYNCDPTTRQCVSGVPVSDEGP